MKKTWKKAIEAVLEDAKGPLHYKEIAEKIVSEAMVRTSGATPAATVNAQITTSIKSDGDSSPFRKLGKGLYTLAQSNKKTTEDISESEEDTEEQYEIVSSFGMFWRRDAIEWKSKPRILGMQQLGADPVDFHNQKGIYLLYDGREVIYVGRSTDRPLGKRLYEHTVDRFSARWNRFSWFGVLPVSDKGVLGAFPESFEGKKLIPALEAILIEALEPRQNRKRGDDLAAVEYIQKEDSEIQKKMVKQTMEAALNKL